MRKRNRSIVAYSKFSSYIYIQLKTTTVMKSILNVLEGLGMGIIVATIFGVVGMAIMYPLAYFMGGL